MWKEFLISVASGVVVSLISARFIERQRRGSGQPQIMTMGSPQARKRGLTSILLAFVLGATIVFIALSAITGHLDLP